MIPNTNHDVAVITEQDALASLVAELSLAPWIAVDTEFLRERNYYAQLCLIQVGTPDLAVCIDPLALSDLSPLRDLFTNPNITKVFHAAFQDMEILLQATGAVPRPVFDTQIAAALLGHADQIGYARLVEAMLGVQLEKAHSRSDWSRRPLKSQEIEYAADDVRYLAALYPQMREQLEQRNRLAWLGPEFDAMTDPSRYRTEPERAWRRVKGWKRLKPAQQQALVPLAAWREQQAMSADRPRGWIVKDEILLDMARRRPNNEEAMASIRGMPDSLVKKHGQTLIGLIEQANKRPAEPLAPLPERLAPEQEPMVDMLMAALKLRAAEIDISPGALATRKDLEQLILGREDINLLQGWRAQAIGHILLALLQGENALRVHNGSLKVD